MRERAREGLDVDARFLLANERTLLAWLRTALTLLAAGVAVQQFGQTIAARLLAGLLVVLGAAAAVVGARRYRAADAALRRGDLPPGGRAPFVIALGVLLLAAGVLVAVVFDLRA